MKRLTKEYAKHVAQFNRQLHTCECTPSSICDSCMHPGNPRFVGDNPIAWEEVEIGPALTYSDIAEVYMNEAVFIATDDMEAWLLEQHNKYVRHPEDNTIHEVINNV